MFAVSTTLQFSCDKMNLNLYLIVILLQDLDGSYANDHSSVLSISASPYIKWTNGTSMQTSHSLNEHHGQNETCTSDMPNTVPFNSFLLTEEGLSKQCVLWDDACSGCVSTAENMFFNYTLGKVWACLGKEPAAESSGLCDAWNYGHHMTKLTSWMRDPCCLSSSLTWDKHPKSQTEPGWTPRDTCCGRCMVQGRNIVDIYYWPSPDADYSCLSIISNSDHAVDVGATTTIRTTTTSPSSHETITFWDCTLSSPDASGHSVITTAVMTTWENVTLQVPRENPWKPPKCVGVSAPIQIQDRIETLIRSQKLHTAQNDSQTPQPSITQIDAELPVTAIIKGYTM